MPLIEDDGPVGDPGQLSFHRRLWEGRVVPIISNRAIFDLALGGYAQFVQSYAHYIRRPGGGPTPTPTRPSRWC